MATAETSIRVSRDTLAEIGRFQRALGAASIDEALQTLLKLKRRELLKALYGSVGPKLPRFTEGDRLDFDR